VIPGNLVAKRPGDRVTKMAKGRRGFQLPLRYALRPIDRAFQHFRGGSVLWIAESKESRRRDEARELMTDGDDDEPWMDGSRWIQCRLGSNDRHLRAPINGLNIVSFYT